MMNYFLKSYFTEQIQLQYLLPVATAKDMQYL